MTSDGQKFLVQVGPPDQSRTLHVVFNWPQILHTDQMTVHPWMRRPRQYLHALRRNALLKMTVRAIPSTRPTNTLLEDPVALSIHRIIKIVFVVGLTDRAAHRQYLSLVIEDMCYDTHDHIRRPEQSRLARIADHRARGIQLRLACTLEIRASRGCRLLAERLDGGYILQIRQCLFLGIAPDHDCLPVHLRADRVFELAAGRSGNRIRLTAGATRRP